MKLTKIIASFAAALQMALPAFAEEREPTKDHAVVAPEIVGENRGAGQAEDNDKLIFDILDHNEAELLAAEKDLNKAKAQLENAKDNRKVSLVMTAAGIAGLVIAAKMIKHGSKNDAGDLLTYGGIGIGGMSTFPATAGASMFYSVQYQDIPKAKKAIEAEQKRVTLAKDKIAQAKARLARR